MQNESRKIQILAPAGSIEQLVAAVNNGCDAVYLGLDSFNARMKAPNFTLDNLSEWVDYCHLFGVKVYAAINTSLKNSEFDKAVDLLLNAYKRNIDGVIVTDLALMRIAGSLPKPFEVVASTQLNIHDKYGAEFVKKIGASTVVCARECSFDEIREIAAVGVDVECFLHGAMCVCQSGQCLFSSIVGGNSGNRGLCAQPCRKYYYAEGDVNSQGYLLSARDMCGLDTADALVKSGATTFKIEGRNRRPEYAGMTSRIYRRLLDDNCYVRDDDFTNLAEMFNRSMTANRYLFGSNSDIIYADTQNHIGVEVGVVKRNGIVAFQSLTKGDGLKIFDGNKEVCGGVALESGKDFVRVQFSDKVVDGMKAYRTTSVKLNEEILSAKRNLDVKISFEAKIGHEPLITATSNGVTVSLNGEFVIEKAQNCPLNESEIIKQLQKSGETHYTITDIKLDIDEIFIAKSQINALRRSVLSSLTECLVRNFNAKFENRKSVGYAAYKKLSSLDDCSGSCEKTTCFVTCYNEQQLQEAFKKCSGLIYKADTVDLKSFDIAAKYDAYLDLPSFADLNLVKHLLDNFRVKLVCNNIGQVELARAQQTSYIAGSGLNIFNDRIANEFVDADTFIYSRELSLAEINDFNNCNGLIFVDGQVALMQLVHCPYKVAFNCDCSTCKADKALVYRDELNNCFVIRRRKVGRCLFELMNGNKMSVVNKLKVEGRYLMDYDSAVVEHYINLNSGFDDGYSESRPYTKGRLYKKIN